MTQGGAVSPAAGAGHRVPLAGTTWSVWRDVCLRSAGFPADMVLAVCDEPLAHSADLAAADRAGAGLAEPGPAYDAVYAAATERLSRAIAAVHADPVFQEALTWQNPRLAQFLDDHGIGQGAARRTKDRDREQVVASYLQRYCLKNDMIGFFGPVGWATATQDTAELVVTPGERLIGRRTTHFEVWAIDKAAAAVAGQGRALGWLRPRRTRSVFLDGNVLHRPHRQRITLTDVEGQVLRACDGRRTITEVVEMAGAPGAHAVLTRLAELGAVRLDLEGPMHAWPERLLRDVLGQIADPGARAAALAPVDELVRARDAVAATVGDPARLRGALTDLAQTFEQVTGAASTRRAGENYAGRTLVYQDSVRDVRVELGWARRWAWCWIAPAGWSMTSPAGTGCCSPTWSTARAPGPAAARCRSSGCSPWHRPICPSTAAGGSANSPRRAWPSFSGAGSWCSVRPRLTVGTRSARTRSPPGPPSASRRARSPGAVPGSTHPTS
jgi:hypothetical protein